MFKGSEGEKISLEEAVIFTENYRDSSSSQSVKAVFFGSDSMNKIMNQKSCVGIRYYFGKNENGDMNIVAVGCNEKGEDMYSGIILEMGDPCPHIVMIIVH